MAVDRTPATAAQAKALGSPIRLRILRMCHHEALTNQQLAVRLGCDPSTMHYHARVLLDTGFLERVQPRHGPTGALEKPLRATGLSWTLDLGTDSTDATLAMFDAFRAELAESGPDSVETMSRFMYHLDDPTFVEMTERIQEVLDEYATTDEERREAGHQQFGGIFALHRIAAATPDDESSSDASPPGR